MDKNNIIAKLYKKYPDLEKEYLNLIVDIFFQTIAANLKEKSRVEIRSFGVFKIKELSDREVFNPHKKESNYVTGKKIPVFKCSKSLHQVNI